jgi:hypothetical protein
MYKQFEIILTTGALLFSAIVIVLIVLRIRSIIKKKNRIAIWEKRTGVLNKIAQLIKAVSIPFLASGFIYFLFVATLPTSVMRDFAKITFCILAILWMIIEFYLCFSIPEVLINGSVSRKITFFLTAVLCFAGAVYLFPMIPKSIPFPPESECVILDLPVKGTWLAGQAGATSLTNGHVTNPYAIDILKLGPDKRFYTGDLQKASDFFSFNEPIYASADGIVTQVVDTLPGDSLGIMDRVNPGGNNIIIDIGNQKYMYLAHLRRGSIEVEKGQTVKTGMFLGRIGNSGYSTSPHLHMQIQNKPVSDQEGRITYPFRFKKMNRTRLFLKREIHNGYLIRNDRFSD